jgi:hypothetical protein
VTTPLGHYELCEAVFEMLVSEGLIPDGEIVARFDVAPIIATGIVRELEARLAISKRAGELMAERIAALLDIAERQAEYIDLLAGELSASAVFLHVHGFVTSPEKVDEGVRLRAAIDEAKGRLA